MPVRDETILNQEVTSAKPRVGRLLMITACVACVNLILTATIFDDPIVLPLISCVLVASIVTLRLWSRKIYADIAFAIYLTACALCYLPVYPGRIGITIMMIGDFTLSLDPIIGVLLSLVLRDIYRSLDDTKSVV